MVFDHYLLKPVRQEALTALIEHTLATERARG